MYKVSLTSEAVKYYKKSDSKVKKELNRCFDELAKSPHSGPDIKKLQGELKGLLRYRVGKLRVIYKISEEVITVIVVAIGSRGDVYK